MNLPGGRLRKDRVVTDPRDPLAEVLDRKLTGYAVFEPQDTLLLDAEGRCFLTFREGIPEFAYFTGTERGGPAALGDLAMPGPYHVKLYELSPARFDAVGNPDELRVPPGMPAERLAGDPALAASTRRAAPADRQEGTSTDGGARSATTTEGQPDTTETSGEESAVEAFLEDEAKIEAIREQARREVAARAVEWDLPASRE